MKKQIKTKQVEQEQKKSFPKILPGLYNWCEDCFPGLMIGSLFLCSFMVLFGWTNINNEMVYFEDLRWDLHGFNWWIILITLIIVTELIFLWICNNDATDNTDMPNIIFAKLLCLFAATSPTIILISIAMFIKELSWIKALGIMKFLGIVVVILIGLYIYFKVNQWLARRVQS